MGYCSKKKYEHKDILLLAMIVGSFLILLEVLRPFYFLSDDNRTFYLPLFAHNFRAIMQGELAFYNFHQYLGIPHFSNFQSAIFYPLIYISIFTSKFFSGHIYWTLDIAVIIHLIIGSLGFYKLIKHFTNDRISAIFAAICWPLFSFNIFVSNSWWIVSGSVAYFPWILYTAFKLYEKQLKKYLALLIILRLLLFYVGHIEYFIYAMLFEFITIIFFLWAQNKDIKSTFLKKYGLSYIFTFIYALPILLPAWMRTKASGIRSANFDFATIHANASGFAPWLKSLLYPFANQSDFYLRTQTKFSIETFPYISHIGYVALALVIFVSCKILIKSKNRQNYIFPLTVFILFLLTLFWSFGWLAGLLQFIPVLNRFRFPFKLIFFQGFFLIFVAGYGLYFLLEAFERKKIRQGIFLGAILLSLLNFYLLYSQVYVSFNYRQHKDDLPLQEEYYEEFKNGRIISLRDVEDDPFSVKTLGYNYATLLGLNHFAGYEPLMPKINYDACLHIKYKNLYDKFELPIDYLRRWGVNWYIQNLDEKTNTLQEHYTEILSNKPGVDLFKEDYSRRIFYDNKANPLIFWESNGSGENIEYKIGTNTIEIKTKTSKPEYLVINFLANQHFTASMSNKGHVPITETDIDQMRLLVPKGFQEIRISYRNPYFYIGLVIVIIVSLGLIVTIFLKKKKS